MTQLRNKMLEELQRRNYSHRTANTYLRIIRDFAEYFHQPPDKLGPEQIRQYQAYPFTSEAEARQMLELAMAVDGAPDKCSCLLVSALMDVSRTVHLGPARWFRDVCYGVSEALIGSERARALAYPQTAWRRLVPLMARISRAMNLVRPWVCGLDRVVQSVGTASWKKIIDMALEAGPPAFTRASRLHTAFLDSEKKSVAGLESVSYGCPETSQIPPVLVEMETHP